MKRAGLLCLVCAATLWMGAALAQEAHEPAKAAEPPATHAGAGHETGDEHVAGGEHGGMEAWKWANFAILAGALGYMIKKNAGPFFSARTQQIKKDMLESQEARRQAEARAAEVDRRLAALESEIAALKAESQMEANNETERLARQTTAEMAKIQAHAEQEIVSAGKAARTELKRYSAELAVALAEQRLRARMTPDTQEALVRGFVRDLEPSKSRATT
jgi:F-type H+-transporting ATPase subunit b